VRFTSPSLCRLCIAATHLKTLQHVAPHYAHDTATHCNTLQQEDRACLEIALKINSSLLPVMPPPGAPLGLGVYGGERYAVHKRSGGMMLLGSLRVWLGFGQHTAHLVLVSHDGVELRGALEAAPLLLHVHSSSAVSAVPDTAAAHLGEATVPRGQTEGGAGATARERGRESSSRRHEEQTSAHGHTAKEQRLAAWRAARSAHSS